MSASRPIMQLTSGSGVVLGASMPSDPSKLVQGYALLDGSRSLLVDGTTPKVFTFDADVTDDIELVEIRYLFSTQDFRFDGASFGKESALASGILLEVTAESSTGELGNVRCNEDFEAITTPGSIQPINSGPNDSVIAGISLGRAMTIKAGSDDCVKVTVRDNLVKNSHKFLGCYVRGVKV